MQLSGKRVLITGAAKRVGAELARHFAHAGAAVVVHCRTSRAEGEELIAGLPGTGHTLVTADLAEPNGPEQLFAASGRIDVLVNNASLYRPAGILHDTLEKAHFDVNFFAPLHLMRLFARQEPPLAEGAIINLLDQEVLHRTPQGGSYSLSRRALLEATLAAARELGERNIRVNAVAPGPVLAPPALAHLGMAKTLAALPLHRKVGLDDLAEAVLFLASNDSITGAVLPVDCGQSLL